MTATKERYTYISLATYATYIGVRVCPQDARHTPQNLHFLKDYTSSATLHVTVYPRDF